MEEFQSLCVYWRRDGRYTGHVAARSIKAGDKTILDGVISSGDEHNRIPAVAALAARPGRLPPVANDGRYPLDCQVPSTRQSSSYCCSAKLYSIATF